jgi:hypothetical protein
MRDRATQIILFLQMGYDARFKLIFIRYARHQQFHIVKEIQYFWGESEAVEGVKTTKHFPHVKGSIILCGKYDPLLKHLACSLWDRFLICGFNACMQLILSISFAILYFFYGKLNQLDMDEDALRRETE